MNTGAAPIAEVRQMIQLRAAIWAYQKFQLRHPELTSALYETGTDYWIHVSGTEEDLAKLSDEFEKMRPATLSGRLVTELPEHSRPVNITSSAADDAWLFHEPLTGDWANDLLCLAAPDLPQGNLTFRHDPEGYVFEHHGLSDADLQRVDEAFKKLRLPGRLRFGEVPADQSPPTPQPLVTGKSDPLAIPTSRKLRRAPKLILGLVEEDEDCWRQFLDARRSAPFRPTYRPPADNFSVLFGADDSSEVALSELLCIYDVVKIVPTHDMGWLQKHSVSLDSLAELVSMGRIKIVLPGPAPSYPYALIEAVANVDRSSVILSRRLAALTVDNGQRKDPLLYGAFSGKERIALLKALRSMDGASPLSPLVSVYANIFENQHTEIFGRGANASFTTGIGALVGELLHSMHRTDVRLQLCTAGAMVEWAAALGSTLLPRSFGDYEESRNATIIANYFNRTHSTNAGRTADRMHAVVDGLLAVGTLSPLDVAKDLTSRSVTQFRQLASGMLNSDADIETLQSLVEKLNDDIRSFERSRGRLSKYRIFSTLVGGLAVAPVAEQVDKAFTGASVIATWIAGAGATLLRDKGLTTGIERPLTELVDAVYGLATMTSLDAVVISRARTELARGAR